MIPENRIPTHPGVVLEEEFLAPMGLTQGGALGNLYDRVCFGYVVDFLEVHWGQYRWPTFNIADSAISVGVFFLAVEILRHENPRRAAG
jgi:signal peptidase II